MYDKACEARFEVGKALAVLDGSGHKNHLINEAIELLSKASNTLLAVRPACMKCGFIPNNERSK